MQPVRGQPCFLRASYDHWHNVSDISDASDMCAYGHVSENKAIIEIIMNKNGHVRISCCTCCQVGAIIGYYFWHVIQCSSWCVLTFPDNLCHAYNTIQAVWTLCTALQLVCRPGRPVHITPMLSRCELHINPCLWFLGMHVVQQKLIQVGASEHHSAVHLVYMHGHSSWASESLCVHSIFKLALIRWWQHCSRWGFADFLTDDLHRQMDGLWK